MCEEMAYVAMMLTMGGERRQGPEVAAQGAAEALLQGILSTRSCLTVGAMLLRSGSGSLGSVSPDPGHRLDEGVQDVEWMSQPDNGALGEQRRALSVWARASGKGLGLEELGKITLPRMEVRDDSPCYGEPVPSPDYGSLREVVEVKEDSPPPLVTPQRAGRGRPREKEAAAAGPKLNGR